MILGLVAISGMLAAEAAAAPRAPAIAAVEISFSTHAGEGAEGRKRFGLDGCYQVESGGSTGGAGYALDSQAGCFLRADVAAVFAKLAAISGGALEREKPARASTTGGAPRNGMAGLSETNVVLIRADGSRWVAANKATADDILRAVNELPSENQWYAKPPEKPIGKGAQLVVLSATVAGRDGSHRLQASLVSDGRWWCYRSVVGESRGQRELPAKKPSPIPPSTATTRLFMILEGAEAEAERDLAIDGPYPSHWKDPAGMEAAVDVVWPGKARSTLGLKPHLHENVVRRFVAEMKTASPTCSNLEDARR